VTIILLNGSGYDHDGSVFGSATLFEKATRGSVQQLLAAADAYAVINPAGGRALRRWSCSVTLAFGSHNASTVVLMGRYASSPTAQ
jgi:hypothetical protein